MPFLSLPLSFAGIPCGYKISKGFFSVVASEVAPHQEKLIQETPRAMFSPVSWAMQALVLLFLLIQLPIALAQVSLQPQSELLRIEQVSAVMSEGSASPEGASDAQVVQLPDDWYRTRPGYAGSVWYRAEFSKPPAPTNEALLGLFIERVCTNLEVYLNGQKIFQGGRMQEPVTRNCYEPQLIALPASLLLEQHNTLDVRVVGAALQQVAARRRAGGLSAMVVGPYESLRQNYTSARFWQFSLVETTSLVLTLIGGFLLLLGGMNRHFSHLMYFGGLLLTYALVSLRVTWQDSGLSSSQVEFMVVCLFPWVAALSVKFLQSYTQLRAPWVNLLLFFQCAAVPLAIGLAGSQNIFVVANVIYALLALELWVAMVIFLRHTWQRQRDAFWIMLALLMGLALMLALEILSQYPITLLAWAPDLHFALPMLLTGLGLQLLLMLSKALRQSETSLQTLENQIHEASVQIEKNFSQLAELKVEQVTEKERKRIAADLHDDLGAKLLTIVHTSDSERISTLAREALEEMRLSVRGLTGKPVRLADALADWRAEIVSRLGQTHIETDWHAPSDEIEHLFSARAYVQTTRILREAVSNIIKHSQATRCTIHCLLGDGRFQFNVHDNGRGIAPADESKLDRGHGMDSMKHRARSLHGECEIQSTPGEGTVISVSIPL
jgi:two-component system, NarL family, sensor histidine kinase UhpB